jgi:GNAT superfamily N-acetyltransferase
VRVVPLTEGRWEDFVDLFTRRGPRGGGGPGSGCWCMWWRGRTRSADGNRAAMESIVRGGEKPGLVAYDGMRAVGWISVAPRESYGQLMRSRDYGPKSPEPGMWSIVCIYVAAADRHQGVFDLLLERGIAYAFERGATAVEAYPHARRSDYMGSESAYRRLGFEPVREAGVRTIMRLER